MVRGGYLLAKALHDKNIKNGPLEHYRSLRR